MRKLVTLLLICLLFLQATVAATGTACLHERDTAVGHFGHHAHEHRLSGADPVSAADLDQTQDHDCTTCHASALSGMPVRPPLLALPTGAVIVTPAAAVPPSSPPPWRPERPNWAVTA